MTAISIVLILVAASAAMMGVERSGVRTTLTLSFKGDVKRETRFLQQYGQLVCTFIAAVLIWQMDPQRRVRICEALWAAVVGATAIATAIKRLVGRARPRSEHAGRFLGPSLKFANYRESFPSSHSASALAFSTVLAMAYPQAAITFWLLGVACAVLRYLMDAHWPSDVLGGIALGYAVGLLAWHVFR